MDPLTQWICDRCSRIISSPATGVVIWRDDERFRRSDFRIVHKECGEYPLYSGGYELTDYLGEDGASLLMSFLAAGPIQTLNREGSGPEVGDLEQFVDFFRRLQIPYYEEARTKFCCQELLDDYADHDETAPYRSEVLREIIERDY